MTAACALLQMVPAKCVNCCDPPRPINLCRAIMGISICFHGKPTVERCWQCDGDEDPVLRPRVWVHAGKPKQRCDFCEKEFAYGGLANHHKTCKLNPE